MNNIEQKQEASDGVDVQILVLQFWASGWHRLYKKSLPLNLQPGAFSEKRDWKVFDRHQAAAERIFRYFRQNTTDRPPR